MRIASDAKAFDVDPMRNSVSGVAARPPAPSASPRPATHSGPSRCTMATDAPGVCVSFRTFSSCCCSSAIDWAGFCFSFLSSAKQRQASIGRRTIGMIRFMIVFLAATLSYAQALARVKWYAVRYHCAIATWVNSGYKYRERFGGRFLVWTYATVGVKDNTIRVALGEITASAETTLNSNV